MEPHEWKLCQLVAVEHLGLPPRIVVALIAALSFLTFVSVVFLVARIAVRFELFLVHIAFVTRGAFDLPMSIAQREFGFVMIE